MTTPKKIPQQEYLSACLECSMASSQRPSFQALLTLQEWTRAKRPNGGKRRSAMTELQLWPSGRCQSSEEEKGLVPSNRCRRGLLLPRLFGCCALYRVYRSPPSLFLPGIMIGGIPGARRCVGGVSAGGGGSTDIVAVAAIPCRRSGCVHEVLPVVTSQ